MKGFENPTYLTWYIISNIIGLIILWIAAKNTRVARIIFSLLFGWAFYFNLSSAINSPDIYLTYGAMSMKWYSDFISGWFKDHITEVVGAIAIGQGLIALGMIFNKVRVDLACIGAILFLIAIAPLGVGSAFPFSISVSVAAYLILRNDKKDFIWKTPVKIRHKSRKIIYNRTPEIVEKKSK